jgi:hypothetical protein
MDPHRVEPTEMLLFVLRLWLGIEIVGLTVAAAGVWMSWYAIHKDPGIGLCLLVMGSCVALIGIFLIPAVRFAWQSARRDCQEPPGLSQS